MKKDIVAGIGEIGKPILKLLSKDNIVVGFDLNPGLMDKRKFERCKNLKTSFLHVTIPVTGKFIRNVLELHKKFQPECIVVHSTIKPGTTEELQRKLPIPVIYSATRGVHKRMIYDLKRYTKFFVISANAPRDKWASSRYVKLMKRWGWLVNYAQLSNRIAIEYGIDYDEMWSFSDEIHKFLGNRPKMYPGYIGGHCVIPNLNLINDETLNLINKMNNSYTKKSYDTKKIYRKYESKLK